MRAFLKIIRDIGLLVGRSSLGVILVMHGWRRWQGGIGAQIDYLTRHGVAYARFISWATTIFELVGGILIVFGLLTPLIGLIVCIQNVLIIVLIKWGELLGFDPGIQLNVALAALGLVFAVFGSGRTGVDALFLPPDREPTSNNLTARSQ